MILRTVISFLVTVPVLSEQITVTEPSVSTAGSRRTMACRCRAMRSTPIASVIVSTAGRPSGTARARADRGEVHLAAAAVADQNPKRQGQRREKLKDRAGEPSGKARHLAKQRRGQRLDLRNEPADLADLGRRAGRDHDPGPWP